MINYIGDGKYSYFLMVEYSYKNKFGMTNFGSQQFVVSTHFTGKTSVSECIFLIKDSFNKSSKFIKFNWKILDVEIISISFLGKNEE